jgi:transcriptional regulator with XRE-family HTH domain
MNSIAFYRKAKGMTQDQLAALMGLSGKYRRVMIQRWEHGKGMSMTNIYLMMELLDCTFEELFTKRV